MKQFMTFLIFLSLSLTFFTSCGQVDDDGTSTSSFTLKGSDS